MQCSIAGRQSLTLEVSGRLRLFSPAKLVVILCTRSVRHWSLTPNVHSSMSAAAESFSRALKALTRSHLITLVTRS
jgi:hypothetical protein